MKILAINCGSSTLKFQLIEAGKDSERRLLASGLVGGLGGRETTLTLDSEGRETVNEVVNEVKDHDAAIRRLLDWLGHNDLDAIGHRVVHGGALFREPTLIDNEVIAAIESLRELTPLHNQPALGVIRAAREALPSVPMVAVFDTAFHAALPEHAALYALPRALADKHRIRRYGFHGLAHRYMTERYAALTSRPTGQVNIVTFQLGNGCSAAAIKGGVSVDTSMGFTPLEGLMMGTRSGDLDPAIVSYLAEHEAVDSQEVEGWLNSRSGLLGVSGRSRDMRELLEAEAQGDAAASLAIEMFCYRARKYLGAYLAALDGADAVIFGGGIGENAPSVRARICEGMSWCGLVLDAGHNAAAVGRESRISMDSSRLHAYVIPVDEAAIIVDDTIRCLRTR